MAIRNRVSRRQRVTEPGAVQIGAARVAGRRRATRLTRAGLHPPPGGAGLAPRRRRRGNSPELYSTRRATADARRPPSATPALRRMDEVLTRHQTSGARMSGEAAVN